MISLRRASVGACSESARRIGSSTSSTNLRQPRQPADGGDRRPAVGHAEVGQAAGGGDHGVEVEHRLAHAHEDDVRDRSMAPEVQRLVEDLPRGQVAAELHLAGRAEGAGQRAAGLRREAHRLATVAEAHQHGLDRMPVGRMEERLHRTVDGLCLVDELERRERHGLARAVRAERRTGSSSRRTTPLPRAAHSHTWRVRKAGSGASTSVTSSRSMPTR